MKFLVFFITLLVSIVSYGSGSNPEIDNLSGSWEVKIHDLERRVITEMTVRFSNKLADSCLGGNWKKIIVESHTTLDKKFFPSTEPLSYEVRDGRVVLGRNQICDAYLHLNGLLDSDTIQGEYVSFGWGTKTLGYFSMNRKDES